MAKDYSPMGEVVRPKLHPPARGGTATDYLNRIPKEQKAMLPTDKNYICADCGRETEFRGYRQARAAGWAISKSYVKCYCPDCAPLHRRGKAADKNFETITQLPDGWEQLKLI